MENFTIEPKPKFRIGAISVLRNLRWVEVHSPDEQLPLASHLSSGQIIYYKLQFYDNGKWWDVEIDHEASEK